jgi:hypothetical protein
MSTSAGNMRTLNVTDPSGNIWVMTMVDASARQAIDEAKNLQFDEDFFTSEVTDSGSTVSVGLNGVPLGYDNETPLYIDDQPTGIVFGSNAPFASAIAPEFTSAANYSANENVMHKGSFYTCISAVSSGSDWDPDYWSATNVNALIGNVETLLAAL